MNPAFLLTAIIFVPTIAAFFLAWFDKRAEDAMKFWTLGATVVTFILTLMAWMQFEPRQHFHAGWH